MMCVHNTSHDVLPQPQNKALGHVRINVVKLQCLIFHTLELFTAENKWKNIKVELQNLYAYQTLYASGPDLSCC